MSKKNKYTDVPQILRDYLNFLTIIKGKSENTVKEYYYDLRMFFRFIYADKNNISNDDLSEIDLSNFDPEVLKKISLSDLYEFMAYVNNTKSSNDNYRARKVSCLRSFFKYLHTRLNYIDVNPAENLDSPKIKKRMPRYLTLEQSVEFLKNIDGKNRERDFAMFSVFLCCGLRLSELVGINLNDIDYEKKTLRVIGKDALFLSSKGNRISNRMVEILAKRYFAAAGIDPELFSPHKLRHTAATLMYKSGNVDIRTLQELLGHTSLATTQIYTHIAGDDLKKAAENNPISNAFNADS